MWDKPEMSIIGTGYKQQELLALAWLSSVRRQVVDRGFTHLGSFDGRHRCGKSITASLLGYLWDETFWENYERRMVNEPRQFVDVIERIAKQNIKGAVIQVDEAGVSMSSSDWYEAWMKTITKMVQMFGYLCPIVLFVAPIKDFVDARLRKMFHAYYKVDRFTKTYVHLTPYNLKYSTIFNKWFYKKPVIRFAGQKIGIRRIKIGIPPSFLIERYENLAKYNKENMLDSFIKDMKKAELKEQKKTPDIDQVILYVVENYKIFETKRSKPDLPILDSTKIEFTYRISSRASRYIKNEAERMLVDKLKRKKEDIEKTGG